MNDRADAQLVRDCQQGDKSAYAVLVQRHYQHVFALCLGLLGEAHDAEDVAQETVLKGFQSIKNLSKAEQFESWLLRIARNLCIDCLRRRKRVKAVRLEPAPPLESEIGDNHDLEQALRRLPSELRLPLTLYYFEHKNAQSVAETLGISHSSACQRIREARHQLHESLTERGRYE